MTFYIVVFIDYFKFETRLSSLRNSEMANFLLCISLNTVAVPVEKAPISGGASPQARWMARIDRSRIPLSWYRKSETSSKLGWIDKFMQLLKIFSFHDLFYLL